MEYLPLVRSTGLGRGQLVSVEVEGGVPLLGGKEKNEKFTTGASQTHAHKNYIPRCALTYPYTKESKIRHDPLLSLFFSLGEKFLVVRKKRCI